MSVGRTLHRADVMHACRSVSVPMMRRRRPGLPEELTASSDLQSLMPASARQVPRRPARKVPGDHARKAGERECDSTASDADRCDKKARCVDQARALAGLGRPHARYSELMTNVEQRVRESLRNSQRSELYGRGIITATGAPSFSLSNRISTRRPEALSSSGRRPSALRSRFAPTTSARSLRSFTSSLSPFHQ